jgi:hypothetical protein
MTKTIIFSAVALCGAAFFLPAAQAEPARAPSPVAVEQMSDVSAHRRHHRRYRAYRSYHPGYVYRRAYASDPSIGYYPTLRRYQRMGRCVHDLGYGRFELCN